MRLDTTEGYFSQSECTKTAFECVWAYAKEETACLNRSSKKRCADTPIQPRDYPIMFDRLAEAVKWPGVSQGLIAGL